MHTFLLLIAALASLCLVVFSYLALTSQLGLSFYVFMSLSISVILLFCCEHFMQKSYYLKRELKKSNTSFNKQEEELKTLHQKIDDLEKELAVEKAKAVPHTDTANSTN